MARPAVAGAEVDETGADGQVDGRPVRARLPFFVASEVGYNGLGGLGLIAGWSPHPFMTLEAGGGGGTSGARLGLRARWNLLTTHVTPFLAVGGIYDMGIDGELVSEKMDPHDITHPGVVFSVAQAYQGFGLQGSCGLSVTRDDGFTMLATGGYLWRSDAIPRSPLPGYEATFINEYAFGTGSGPVVTLAFGLAF